jgi:aminoglycoside phosphotransferase (APT) family kinase protein
VIPLAHRRLVRRLASRPRLVRSGSTSLWQVGDAAVRVCTGEDRALEMVPLVQTLAQAGFPVPEAAPIPGVGELVLREDGLTVSATVWLASRDELTPADWQEAGRLASRLHAGPTARLLQQAVESGELRPVRDTVLAQVERARQQLEKMANLPRLPITRQRFEEVCRHFEDAVDAERASRQREPVFCHGDLQAGNLMPVGEPGAVVLCDWELAGWGTSAVDHAPLRYGARRFGLDPAIVEAFADGYGTAMPGEDALEAATRRAEFQLAIDELARATRFFGPSVVAEANLRVGTLLLGKTGRWSEPT